jgi:hypothetical protein
MEWQWLQQHSIHPWVQCSPHFFCDKPSVSLDFNALFWKM